MNAPVTRRTFFSRWRQLALGAVVAAVTPAVAAPVYIAVGDSIAFGEIDLSDRQSLGDRSFVGLYADALAVRGIRPMVVNLAIDGVDHAAAYAYLDDRPTESTVADPFGGMLPVGNVHSNAVGYGVIAAQVASVGAVPKPVNWSLLVFGLVVLYRLRSLGRPARPARAASGFGLHGLASFERWPRRC